MQELCISLPVAQKNKQYRIIISNSVDKVSTNKFAKMFNMKATMMGLDNEYLDNMCCA